MKKRIKIMIMYPNGQRKTKTVNSVDEAFGVCRATGGVDWKAISYRPKINRADL